MVNIPKFVGRTLTSPVGAVEAPCPAPHDLLNVGPGDIGVKTKVGQVLRGVSAPVRGVAAVGSSLSGVAALTALDEVSGANIVPESTKEIVLEASSRAMSAIGETASNLASKAYEGAIEAMPEWIQTGVEMADYIPDFLSVSGQVVQYLIKHLGEDADNIVLLGQLTAAMLVSQAIAGGLATLNVRRTKVDRFLTAGVKASVAAVLGAEAVQAYMGNSDLIGDIPLLISANEFEEMQDAGHWLTDQTQRQTTWAKTALSGAGLTALWAAWDGVKGRKGEIGLLERRKGGWLDQHLGTSKKSRRDKISSALALESK